MVHCCNHERKGEMRQRHILTAVVFGVLAAGLLESRTSFAQEPLRVGIGAPLSGFFGAAGNEILRGAEAAAERINSQGGVTGRKIALITADDKCQADVSSTAARKMIEVDKVDALIGFPCGSSAVAARDIAGRAKTLLISLTSAPVLTASGARNVVRLMGREDALARMSVDHLKAKFGNKKIGAWLSASAPGFSMVFQNAATTRGLTLAHVESKGAPDAPPPNWSDTEVRFVSSGVANEWLLRFAGTGKDPLVAAKAVLSQSDITLLQEHANIEIIANPGPGSTGPTGQAMAPETRDMPAGYYIYGFAAVELFGKLAAQSRDLSGEALATVARERDAATVLGGLRFADNGDPLTWRFIIWSKSGAGAVSVNAVDVCKADDCKSYPQCPPDCPK
jgi:ABC-type branched-subunit amino acid transport system substrate-binding protein